MTEDVVDWDSIKKTKPVTALPHNSNCPCLDNIFMVLKLVNLFINNSEHKRE